MDPVTLQFRLQLITRHKKEEILQLMQIPEIRLPRYRLAKPQPVRRKFKVDMAVADTEDPVLTHKIPESALFQYPGRQENRLNFLKVGFLDHFDKLAGIGRPQGPPDGSRLAANFDLSIVNERVGENLLHRYYFTILRLDFVSVSELFSVYHRVYF